MLVLHGLPLFASFLALLPLFPSSNPHPEKAKIMKNSASKIAIELAINIKVTGYDFGDFKHEYDELSDDDWISLVDEASCLLDDLRDTGRKQAANLARNQMPSPSHSAMATESPQS
jgi:hypothetical protein